MRQFDAYENPLKEARRYAPYVVVLSSHYLVDFDDAVVAPLVNDSLKTVPALELLVEIGAEQLVLVLSELAGIRRRSLRHCVGSLAAYEDDIRRALDRLFTGF